ncbi:MAG: efflux RND transporter periplasmic adaptor subunit [Methylovulum sp.]|nr:efflux RND transporter periplasmic adaptor subunit [Methylovulum sp.]
MLKTKLSKNSDIVKVLGLEQTQSNSLYKTIGWAITLLLIALLAIVVNRQQAAEISYSTETVTRGDLTMTVSATGTLAPVKEVEVGIEVSGTIKSVAVDYNDQVKIGQVIARLDTTRLEAQALQSEASLAAAKAKVQQIQAGLQEAKIKISRLMKALELSGGKVPSQYELDTAKSNLGKAVADELSAKASVAQAQASLDVNRTDLAKAVVHSPINGVVLERSVEPGQTVASQFQAPVLFTLAEDLTQMELQVDVDEADVGSVKEGQVAEFTVDAYPDRKFPARIIQVRYSAQTVEGVVTYKTVLKVDNGDLELRPGMTATAVITVNKKTNVILVPNAVLSYEPAQQTPEQQSENSGLLSMILPKPPVDKSGKPPVSAKNGSRQQVWVLKDGVPVAKSVTKGLSDGVMTEITGDDLIAGTVVISAAQVVSR